jgi:ferredoxin
MSEQGKRLFVCSCDGTMPLDARGLGRACGRELHVHRQLCRGEIANVADAARDGADLLICCTQESPLFDETVADAGPDGTVSYVNIREHAGWSGEAAKATPKIAALIAAAAIEAPPARTLSFASAGRTLVYGVDDDAVAAAAQLAGRLDVTLILVPPGEAVPPRVTGFPVFRGRINAASGRLGAFAVTVDDLAAADPSSRAGLSYGEGAKGVAMTFDIVVDLSGGAPLIGADEKRDGYLRADPASPAAVQKALFDASDMVGEFEKPIYVAYEESLCAHSRSRVTGCTRCLDLCPVSAIAPAGDHVAIDREICAGCGSCASVCPTGAASYALPATEPLYRRLRTMLRTYRDAGGEAPAILFHDTREGEALIAMAARFGRGLPANVLPVALNETTQLSFDIVAAALAYGAARVVALAPVQARDRLDGVAGQIAIAETLMEGLGYGAGRARLIVEADPDALCDALYDLDPAPAVPPSGFLPMGGRRSLTGLSLQHLYEHAPTPTETLPLAAGAPFGAVAVDTEGCTLCLACVGACPTGALGDNPDAPMLTFTEQACVQCGLCRATCPENAIALEPRFNFAAGARQAVTLKQEEPHLCVSCGKPFGTKSAIERVVEKLAGHSMFAGDAGAIERLRMCEECRVLAQFADRHQMAGASRRVTRTTDDYISGAAGDDEADDVPRSRGNGKDGLH